MTQSKQIRTSRLVLRRQEPKDAEPIAELLNNWNVVRWLSRIPHPYGIEDAREWIRVARQNWEEGSDHQFVIALQQGGTLIGHCGLRPDGEGGADFGYWYGEPFWGQGYAREAGRAVIEYGFAEMGLSRVWAPVHPDNRRSLQVLEASGLRSVGTRPVTFLALGETVGCQLLALERTDHQLTGGRR